MKESRRAKRITKHHRRGQNRIASLNMVSLMDIFTILVFFLLVTSSESEILPSPKAVQLPQSSAEKYPVQTLVIMVNKDDIRINDKPIAIVTDVLNSPGSTIPELKEALLFYQSDKSELQNKKAITIMGDREIPYQLLKKIMLTCATNKFGNISLAVVQKSIAGGQ